MAFESIKTVFMGSYAYTDAALPWQLSFQDPATPIMEGIIRFHTDLMTVLVAVCVFVGWMLYRISVRFNIENISTKSRMMMPAGNGVHGTTLEIVWTIVPALILMVIAVPSFALLYSIDELNDPALTVKVIGHQWYWTYEYGDFFSEEGENIVFDSYMVADEDLEVGQFRLLETDLSLVLPVGTHTRLIVTAADVLHSFAVPSFGRKMDACPGRLNQVSLYVNRPGRFYGQCSEICGINHGFMPISIDVVEAAEFHQWVETQLAPEEDDTEAAEEVVEAVVAEEAPVEAAPVVETVEAPSSEEAPVEGTPEVKKPREITEVPVEELIAKLRQDNPALADKAQARLDYLRSKGEIIQ